MVFSHLNLKCVIVLIGLVMANATENDNNTLVMESFNKNHVYASLKQNSSYSIYLPELSPDVVYTFISELNDAENTKLSIDRK